MNKEDILIDSVVDAIGDTPLVELSRLVKDAGDAQMAQMGSDHAI